MHRTKIIQILNEIVPTQEFKPNDENDKRENVSENEQDAQLYLIPALFLLRHAFCINTICSINFTKFQHQYFYFCD